VRWIAPLIVACLLSAGAAPRRACAQQRHEDAIAAAKVLVTLAVRRSDGIRPVGKLDLDPIALPNARSFEAPPRAACNVVHAAQLVRVRVAAVRATARGPPVG
jgi:hypothetical protein